MSPFKVLHQQLPVSCDGGKWSLDGLFFRRIFFNCKKCAYPFQSYPLKIVCFYIVWTWLFPFSYSLWMVLAQKVLTEGAHLILHGRRVPRWFFNLFFQPSSSSKAWYWTLFNTFQAPRERISLLKLPLRWNSCIYVFCVIGPKNLLAFSMPGWTFTTGFCDKMPQAFLVQI